MYIYPPIIDYYRKKSNVNLESPLMREEYIYQSLITIEEKIKVKREVLKIFLKRERKDIRR